METSVRFLSAWASCAAQFAAMAVCFVAPAHAQDFARSGPYLGVGVLGGTFTQLEDDLDEGLLFGEADVQDASLGFEVYGGYRIVPNFALELEFEMLPQTEVEVLGTESEQRVLDVTGNGKVFLLTERVQPYLLAGAGYMNAEIEVETILSSSSETESAFVARFGGGVDIYLTESAVLSVGADYLLPTDDLDGLDHVTYGGGLQYRF